MSLPCQSRTNIVQHVLSLTLCRHYTAPPNPRNLSSSAVHGRPSVTSSTVSSDSGAGDVEILAGRDGRQARLPGWLLELQASSSGSSPLRPIPRSASDELMSPIGTPRRRGRRKPPVLSTSNPSPFPSSLLTVLSTRQDSPSSYATAHIDSIFPWTLDIEPELDVSPDSSAFEQIPIPSTLDVPQSPIQSSTTSTQPAIVSPRTMLPRVHRPGSPAAILEDKLGSRIHHEKSRLERDIGQILQSISDLPTDLPSLKRLSTEYVQVLELLVPSVESGFWSKRSSYFHRSLREVSVAHVKVLQRIKDQGGPRPSTRLAKSFTPLIVSLIVNPDLQLSSKLPNHWKGINLVGVVETILGLGLDLTPFQLSMIMRYMAGHRAIRSPKSRKAMNKRGNLPMTADHIAHTWSLRRRLFDILDQSSIPTLEVDAFRAEVTMSTINDASVIGLEMVIAYPVLKARLAEAMLYRDANLQRWIDLSRRTNLVILPGQDTLSIASELTNDWNARMALLRVVLQQHLLSRKLRARSPLSPPANVITPYPEQILTRMIQDLKPDHTHSSPPTRSTVYLCSAIFLLRNRYMKEGHFYKLVNLIRHLGRPTTQCPPLPGQVIASLISATRTPAELPTLLLLLYRLPNPTTPVRFPKLWRRSLTKMSIIADRNGIPFRSSSIADAEAKVIWDKTGWEGLWKSALVRWGYGYSMTQHAAMLHAQDEGRVKSVQRQMKRRAEKIKRLFKTTAYDSEATTFPMMHLPSSAAVDVHMEEIGKKDQGKT